MPRHELRELFAFIVIDGQGREGMLNRADGLGPMIADSRDNLEAFRAEAEACADDMRMALRVVRFYRTHLFEPWPLRRQP